MSWKTLIPISLIGAAIAVLVIILSVPTGAQRPPTGCARQSGDDCASVCVQECSNGSCCFWRHYNYP